MATPINHWKQANSDYAVVQPGSLGAGKAALVLGAKSGRPVPFDYDDLRLTLMNGGNPEYVGFFEEFDGAAVSTKWATNLSTGASISVNAQLGGAVRFTTDTDDDDFATLARGLNWSATNGFLFFEARVKSVTAITLRAIEIGLSDALSETNGLAFSNHSVAGVTDVATDAVVFGYDTDSSMTAWAANAVKNGTPQAVNTAVAPSTSYQRFSIFVNTAGDAYFYIDGELVATITDAITPTVALTPFISLKSLSAAAKSIDVDFVSVVGYR